MSARTSAQTGDTPLPLEAARNSSAVAGCIVPIVAEAGSREQGTEKGERRTVNGEPSTEDRGPRHRPSATTTATVRLDKRPQMCYPTRTSQEECGGKLRKGYRQSSAHRRTGLIHGRRQLQIMEETIARPGFFSRLAGLVNRNQEDYEDDY